MTSTEDGRIITRATIYTRVSSDHSGEYRSVTEQEAECRAECARRGWDVVAHYSDNDRGASRYSAGQRDDYAALVEWVRAGRTDVVVFWEDSRMTRMLEEYATLRNVSRETRTLWCIQGQIRDMNVKGDRMITLISAMQSEEASEETSARVRRSVNARIAAGRPHGRLVYGYRREYHPSTGAFLRQVPDEITAPIVREIAARFLGGDTMWTVHRDLNARGVASIDREITGKDADGRNTYGEPAEWTHNMIRRVLMNPHYAGIRVRNGAEETVRGDWEPLISEDDHRVIVARLSDPARRTQRDTQAVHLLTGIAECGRCGKKMRYATNRGNPSYQCPGCYLSRIKSDVDIVVSARITGDLIADLPAPADADLTAAREVEALEIRIKGIEDAITSGDMPPVAGGRMLATLEVSLTDARARAVPPSLPPAVGTLLADLDAAGEHWEAMPVAARRDAVRALATVTILPAGKGKRTFDPSLIVVKPRAAEQGSEPPFSPELQDADHPLRGF